MRLIVDMMLQTEYIYPYIPKFWDLEFELNMEIGK